jgi:hypothetical protein
MRDGPSSLKPPSSRRKRTRKRKKEELTFWPSNELLTSLHKSSAAIKIATTATSKAAEIPVSSPNKPTAAANTSKMATIMVQDTPFSGQAKPEIATKTGAMATGKAQDSPATAPSVPKELIEQHALSIRLQPGVGLKEVEMTIRSIESPCGNVVWSSSRVRKPQGGKGPATLQIIVIYNDCSRHKTMPYACRRMRNIPRRGFSPSHETLTMEDVVGRVRGLTKLVAACEVVARRSWAVNAVSHGGNPRAS